jgi:hypothetical protein
MKEEERPTEAVEASTGYRGTFHSFKLGSVPCPQISD